MSLTSYRAAPPRVTMQATSFRYEFLSELRAFEFCNTERLSHSSIALRSYTTLSTVVNPMSAFSTYQTERGFPRLVVE